jgi:5-methylcytosine-specific restriction endonuclease McrA
LVVRDRRCRWPGCDRPPAWCEGHHVEHWEHGGRTNLANLVLLCSRHHHRAHTPGRHVKLLADATFVVRTAGGEPFTTRPPPRC